MLSRNFRLQKVGNLKWLKKNYNFSHIAFSIDELIILDVSRGERNESDFCDHVKSLTEECFVPIAAGGGIRSLEQARKLLHSGADKVVINSLMAIDKELVNQIASEFGRQAIVAAVDVKKIENNYTVWTHNGEQHQETSLTQWLTNLEKSSAGEVYLNSIDRDGTGQGYYLDLLDHLPEQMSIPVILAGGAGKYQHLAEGLSDDRVDAVATAHLFNFIGDGLEKARNGLIEEGFDLAKWDVNVANDLNGIFAN